MKFSRLERLEYFSEVGVFACPAGEGSKARISHCYLKWFQRCYKCELSPMFCLQRHPLKLFELSRCRCTAHYHIRSVKCLHLSIRVSHQLPCCWVFFFFAFLTWWIRSKSDLSLILMSCTAKGFGNNVTCKRPYLLRVFKKNVVLEVFKEGRRLTEWNVTF